MSDPMQDPAVLKSLQWQRHCDRLEEAVRLTSARERALHNATDGGRDEAQRLFVAAAKVRDDFIDDLEAQASALVHVPAQSFEGAAAKLAVVIRAEEPSPTDPTPPFPALRSVKADLDRLIAAMKGNAANDDG
ncbi:hypothetical protein [Roseiterribacter gracilis]|uniref:Uncharacterized protein n=1 Tax=Roseiterribacter gracilis TaxID=2812848 RepID=A0A8S8XF31_9PROT|nr:hypothetical protein TMPK1_34610 [Rhodospirillales bacterium TMPK1]